MILSRAMRKCLLFQKIYFSFVLLRLRQHTILCENRFKCFESMRIVCLPDFPTYIKKIQQFRCPHTDEEDHIQGYVEIFTVFVEELDCAKKVLLYDWVYLTWHSNVCERMYRQQKFVLRCTSIIFFLLSSERFLSLNWSFFSCTGTPCPFFFKFIPILKKLFSYFICKWKKHEQLIRLHTWMNIIGWLGWKPWSSTKKIECYCKVVVFVTKVLIKK